MVKLRAKLGLAFEAFEVRGLLRELGRKNLDHNRAVEFGVECLVNRPLAAGTDLFDNLVLVNLRTNHKSMHSAQCKMQNKNATGEQRFTNPKLTAKS